ncbi:MAG: tetratricopeptide repeat protein [Alteromonadaceae bacterium]|nr:tetratricopeptide repeat protein [Alteromonadaceae bacterium]
MNELLLSELESDEKSILQKIILIEEFIFSSTLVVDGSWRLSIDDVIAQCLNVIDNIEDPLLKAEQMINELFIGQLLLDNPRDSWPILAYQIKSALDYREISPVLKSVLIRHIIEQCGFDTDIVFVPEKAMIRIVCDDLYAIIFDPVTGESLNWKELDLRLDEQEGDPSQQDLIIIDDKDILFTYLTSLKGALINEKVFDKALKCVDILLSLRPNDPFERRDRGFLLHQLDCFKVAYDDYRYFVQQCPKDPAAQLLKMQLDLISFNEAILH